MSFFYDLFGAHTPKRRFIIQTICLVISLVGIGNEVINGNSIFWVVYWGFTGLLSGYYMIDEYFEMRKGAHNVEW